MQKVKIVLLIIAIIVSLGIIGVLGYLILNTDDGSSDREERSSKHSRDVDDEESDSEKDSKMDSKKKDKSDKENSKKDSSDENSSNENSSNEDSSDEDSSNGESTNGDSSDDGNATTATESDTKSRDITSHIVNIKASSYLEDDTYDYSPECIMDGDLSTAWVEGADGVGYGESLEFVLDQEYVIDKIVIYNGYQKSDDLYEKNSRLSSVNIYFPDSWGDTYVLRDIKSEQVIRPNYEEKVGSVFLSICEVYEGSKYEDTAISEIHIWGH